MQQFLKSIWNRINPRYISVLLFLMQLTTEKYEIGHERKLITHEKKFHTKNSHEKNFVPTKYPRSKTWTHEILTKKISDPRNTTREYIGHTKYSQGNIFDHGIPTKTQWHDSSRPMRPLIARDPRNLARYFCFHEYFQKQPLRGILKNNFRNSGILPRRYILC